MKNLFVIVFSILLLAPPIQAHTDTIVYNDVIETHIDVDDNHEKEHHKNDSDDEKNTEHHHHCNSVNLINIFLITDNKINFTDFSQIKDAIIYYENTNYSSYLNGIFQPPKSLL